MKDAKEGLSSGRKPDMANLLLGPAVYEVRAFEYGSDKYERGNFLRDAENLKEAFEQYEGYIAAEIRHLLAINLSLTLHRAKDPQLQDQEGMRKAAYAEDTDVTPGSTVPASGLPHECGARASSSMRIQKAIQAGLLPADPGQPWRRKAPEQTDGLKAFLAYEQAKADQLKALSGLNSVARGKPPEQLSFDFSTDTGVDLGLKTHNPCRMGPECSFCTTTKTTK